MSNHLKISTKKEVLLLALKKNTVLLFCTLLNTVFPLTQTHNVQNCSSINTAKFFQSKIHLKICFLLGSGYFAVNGNLPLESILS